MSTNHEDIINQLPGDLRRIAEILDVESALKLEEVFGGTYLYVHKLDHLRRDIRNKRIREEYGNKARVQNIAIRHRLTERQIWNILGVEPEEAPSLPLLDLLK